MKTKQALSSTLGDRSPLFKRPLAGTPILHALSCILLLLLLLAASGGNAAGAIRDGGIDPANLGKGEWLYYMSSATNQLGGYVPSVTDENSLMAYLKSQGTRYVIVKAATSDQLFNGSYSFPQFTTNVVNAAHANGLWIFGYNRSYGANIPAEIAITDYVFAQGADGFVWDAEAEWESNQAWIGTNGPALAWQLCSAVRSNWPTKFLAHAPFAIVGLHSSFPYKEFGYWCDAAMPQIYHFSATRVPSAAINWTDVNWTYYQNLWSNLPPVNLNGVAVYWTNALKPVVPVQDVYGPPYSSPTPDKDVLEFMDYLAADPNTPAPGGYRGANFFRADLHDAQQWAYISGGTPGTVAGVVDNIVLDEAKASVVGTATSVRTYYLTNNSTPRFEGCGSGTDTDSFGTNYVALGQGSGGNYVEFTPNIVVPGDYTVYQWHPYRAEASAGVPFVITYNGGSTTVYANQQTNDGNWSLLGTFNFAAGGGGSIRVTDAIAEAGGVALADGIKLVFASPATVAPAAPSGLTASAVSSAQIDLGWSNNATNAVHNVVGRATVAGGPYMDIAVLPFTSTGYSDTGLAGETTYYYVVRAVNGAGASANSDQASATTAPAPPTIVLHPVSQTAVVESDVTFSVTASGAPPLHYQWRFNGTNIAGATQSTYTLTSVQASDAGNYSAVVTNGVGGATSWDAALLVVQGIFTLTVTTDENGSVTRSPDQENYEAGTVVMVTAVPNAGYGFAGWSGDVTSTDNPLYVTMTTNIAITANFAASPTDIVMDNTDAGVTFIGSWATGSSAAGRYGPDYRFASTIVSGAASTATYRPTITVAGYYNIYAMYPAGGNRAYSTPFTIQTDDATIELAINQRSNGGVWLPLVSQTAHLSPDSDVYVQISNLTGYSGSVVIADAVRFELYLADTEEPVIVSQPANQVVGVGGTASFSVTARGAWPLSYFWQRDGLPIAGATGSTYTTNNVQLADSGSQFSCLVSNAYGTVLSSNAVLTVLNLPTDYFSELLDTSIINLAFHTYTFTPNGSINVYGACREPATVFPTDPAGGSQLLLGDDDYAQVVLSGGNSVAIYGARSDVLYVGSNGYLTLGAGDYDWSPDYDDHFAFPRVAALYRDLSPNDGGTVTWKQLSDRVAVTYQDVPIYGSSGRLNSFQVEMWFDGRIRITYLGLNTPSGLVGLSAGAGVPINFVPSDFAAYGPCGPQPPVIVTPPADQTVPVGGAATFSVAAFGSQPLSYSWMRNGVPIAGASSSSYTTNNVRSADSGSRFSCLVTNAFGSVTSQVATLTVIDPAIISQPVSQNRNLGESVAFSVTAAGTPPLSYQWWKDGVALAQATGAALTLANLQGPDAGSYWVVVSNLYGSVTSAVAILTLNLASADTFNPGANSEVYSLAVQRDGKILVGGYFTTLGGETRYYIGRLNADGSADTTFNPGAGGGSYPAVYSLAVQADGKILAGGTFTTLAGQTRYYIGRLNSNGTLDTTFNPGANSDVYSLAVQPDGKILVGGTFTTLAGQTRYCIGRLNSNGTLDSTFNPGVGAGGSLAAVYSLALEADGKILVGGSFTSLGGQTRNRIGRLNSDGTLDPSFNPGAGGGSYPAVYSLAMQADGKVLVGGTFTTLVGQPRYSIGRLNSNGTLDPTFNPGAGGTYPYVFSLAVQADGKILVGGGFTSLGGQTRDNIGRLNSDGTLDPTFNPGAGGGGYPAVYSLAVQPDGKILVGGYFTTLAGQARYFFGRLNATDQAAQSLTFDGSTLTWLRGGTSPEVWRATLDVSSNGTDWLSLGTGTRLPAQPVAGWQWPNVSVAVGTIVRARGFVAGGMLNASSWFAETNLVTSAPFIVSQLGGTTNNVGTDVTLSVVAGGTPTLSYQWRKDGTNLLGATRNTLTLTNVQESDQGLYSAVVSNAFGYALSSDVWLTVNQPPIADASATQPLVISANGTDAQVILNGTRSTDPDGDLLYYLWFSTLNSQPSTLLASGAVAMVVLPLGAHPILLVVDDGMLTATNAVTIEVMTAAQGVERLMAQVTQNWPRSQPLVATLSAALRSIERGNLVSAINQLLAFQNQVRAQVAPSDPELAAAFIQTAQEIVEALSGGATNPAGRPHGRFTAVARQPNGRLQMQFTAEPGRLYILEASSNLVDWEMISLAEDRRDGTFECEDANAAKFLHRFYRLHQQ